MIIKIIGWKEYFPFNILNLNEGVKYIGYNLKPNNYMKENWSWLLSKFEQKISFSCNIWLFRGSTSIGQICIRSHPYFLAYFSSYPIGTLEKIRKCCSNFFWKGGCQIKGYHLARWKMIATPKPQGVGLKRHT